MRALIRRLLCRLFDHKWSLPDGLASSHRVCDRCELKEELGPLIPDSWTDAILNGPIYPGSIFIDAWKKGEKELV